MRDHLVTGPAVHTQRNFVAHRSRREEKRGLFSEQLRDHLLERVDRRILELLLVADLGIAHESPHLARGTRHGVALQIDLDHWHGLLPGLRARVSQVWYGEC